MPCTLIEPVEEQNQIHRQYKLNEKQIATLRLVQQQLELLASGFRSARRLSRSAKKQARPVRENWSRETEIRTRAWKLYLLRDGRSERRNCAVVQKRQQRRLVP